MIKLDLRDDVLINYSKLNILISKTTSNIHTNIISLLQLHQKPLLKTHH